MANFSFNISLGREVEFYNRVENSDPTNAAFIGVVLTDTNLEADTLLRDYDTLAAIIAGGSTEVTNTNYARFTWTDADLSPYTVDDTFDRITLQLPSKTGTSIAAGTSWRKMIVCYDNDTTGGTDANLVPVKGFDMLNPNGTPIIPDGGNILCAWPFGFHVAS